MGGPPPPPMPFGMMRPAAPAFNPQVAQIKKIPKTTKLKGVQWTKIMPNQLGNTIFANLPAMDDILKEMPYDKLEEDFAAKKVAQKEPGEKEKPKAANIIDSKKTQNIAILAKGLGGLKPDEIRKAVERVDERVLKEPSIIKSFVQCVPTKDEVDQINEFTAADPDNYKLLGPAEHFCLEMYKIPQLEKKLNALEAKMTYPSKYSDLLSDVSTVDAACDQLLESQGLKKMFGYILMFCNFLNSNTPRAGFLGFKLGSLAKLSDAKTGDNKRTFVNVLAEYIQENQPDLVKFTEEIAKADDVTRVPGAQLEGDINGLIKSVKDIENAVKVIERGLEKTPDDEGSKRFMEYMNDFLAKSTDESKSLKEKYNLMWEKYKKVLAFFNEDVSKPQPPEEFFKMFADFNAAWDKSVEENTKAKEEAARKKRLEEQKAARMRQKAAEAEKKANKGGVAVDNGIMGDLEEMLSKSGGTRKKK